jgi:hypothetical protein
MDTVAFQRVTVNRNLLIAWLGAKIALDWARKHVHDTIYVYMHCKSSSEVWKQRERELTELSNRVEYKHKHFAYQCLLFTLLLHSLLILTCVFVIAVFVQMEHIATYKGLANCILELTNVCIHHAPDDDPNYGSKHVA